MKFIKLAEGDNGEKFARLLPVPATKRISSALGEVGSYSQQSSAMEICLFAIRIAKIGRLVVIRDEAGASRGSAC